MRSYLSLVVALLFSITVFGQDIEPKLKKPVHRNHETVSKDNGTTASEINALAATDLERKEKANEEKEAYKKAKEEAVLNELKQEEIRKEIKRKEIEAEKKRKAKEQN